MNVIWRDLPRVVGDSPDDSPASDCDVALDFLSTVENTAARPGVSCANSKQRFTTRSSDIAPAVEGASARRQVAAANLEQRFLTCASDIDSAIESTDARPEVDPANSRQRFATCVSEIASSVSDGVAQGFEYPFSAEVNGDCSFQWLPDANHNNGIWLGVDFDFEENEYPAPPILKRRFQSMLAWTEREARALQAEENAQCSKGKRQPAPEDRLQCRSVELKPAIRSPGPGRPHSICSHCWGHGRSRERSPRPPFRARRPNTQSSSAPLSNYNDVGELMDESFTEVMLTTSLCSRDPGSSLMKPSPRVNSSDWQGSMRGLSPSGVAVTQSAVRPGVATTNWQSYLRNAELRHIKTRERFLVTAEVTSSPMIPRSLLQETNNGLMGGTLFMDDDGFSPYAPSERESARVLKRRGPPRRPRCLGALPTRLVV